VKFLCDQCKAKYQIADEKVAGKTVRMKCRKCGHLIEVRAAVTESSAATAAPPAVAPAPPAATRSSKPPPPPRPPPKPAPARQTQVAASLTAAKPPPPKPDRAPPPGALAGAFKSTVQHDEDSSAPLDMSELSVSDDWYVAVNGVPVGPVRIGEIRRKAALGAVTEDSLAWQEGLDEWRPVRSFPELAAIVREAASTARMSGPPPPPRSSIPPPRPLRPSSPGMPPRVPSGRPSAASITPPAPAARSNVVPIMSRLATAEKLDHASPDLLAAAATAQPAPEARPIGSVAPDPFAPLAAPAAAIAPPGGAAPIVASPSLPAPLLGSGRKQPNWIVIAMLVMAASFGLMAGYVYFFPPTAAKTGTPSATAATGSAPTMAPSPTAAAATAPGAADTSENVTVTVPAVVAARPSTSAAAKSASAAAASALAAGGAPGRSLDLHSLTQGTNVAPTDDPVGGSEGPKAAGQCFSEAQVQQVIQMHQLAIRRACWERSSTAKLTANVSVQMTISPDGSAQNVAANGDDPAVAKCIENDVRGWHFPALGCSQKTGFSFKFVRQ